MKNEHSTEEILADVKHAEGVLRSYETLYDDNSIRECLDAVKQFAGGHITRAELSDIAEAARQRWKSIQTVRNAAGAEKYSKSHAAQQAVWSAACAALRAVNPLRWEWAHTPQDAAAYALHLEKEAQKIELKNKKTMKTNEN